MTRLTDNGARIDRYRETALLLLLLLQHLKVHSRAFAIFALLSLSTGFFVLTCPWWLVTSCRDFKLSRQPFTSSTTEEKRNDGDDNKWPVDSRIKQPGLLSYASNDKEKVAWRIGFLHYFRFLPLAAGQVSSFGLADIGRILYLANYMNVAVNIAYINAKRKQTDR